MMNLWKVEREVLGKGLGENVCLYFDFFVSVSLNEVYL